MCVCVCVCMYGCMNLFIYLFMYVCMYVCINKYLHDKQLVWLTLNFQPKCLTFKVFEKLLNYLNALR